MAASWLRDMAVHVQAAGAMPDETDRYGKIPVRLEKRLMAFQREGVKFALRHGGPSAHRRRDGPWARQCR